MEESTATTEVFSDESQEYSSQENSSQENSSQESYLELSSEESTVDIYGSGSVNDPIVIDDEPEESKTQESKTQGLNVQVVKQSSEHSSEESPTVRVSTSMRYVDGPAFPQSDTLRLALIFPNGNAFICNITDGCLNYLISGDGQRKDGKETSKDSSEDSSSKDSSSEDSSSEDEKREEKEESSKDSSEDEKRGVKRKREEKEESSEELEKRPAKRKRDQESSQESSEESSSESEVEEEWYGILTLGLKRRLCRTIPLCFPNTVRKQCSKGRAIESFTRVNLIGIAWKIGLRDPNGYDREMAKNSSNKAYKTYEIYVAGWRRTKKQDLINSIWEHLMEKGLVVA